MSGFQHDHGHSHSHGQDGCCGGGHAPQPTTHDHSHGHEHAQSGRLDPPTLQARDATSISIIWHKPASIDGLEGYKVRYRRDKDLEWLPLSDTVHIIKDNGVKKKNLIEGDGYFFSIIPVYSTEGSTWSWSSSSQKLTPAAFSLSPFLSNLFPPTLLSKKGQKTIATAEALGGKVVALYFSAHWCGPCRQFTPLLKDLHQQCVAAGKTFEVIFVSADRTENDFLNYFNNDHGNWTAVNFNDAKREIIMEDFKISSIPRLCILKPTGEVLQDNVQASSLSPDSVDRWIAQCK